MNVFLGIDVGSVSSNFVIVDEDLQVLDAIYLRTQGKPLEIIKTGLMQIYTRLSKNQRISGVGTIKVVVN